MNLFGYSEFRTRTKLLWSVSLAITIAVVGLAIATVSQLPVSKVAILVSAMFVSALISQHELRLPKASVEISLGHVIAIWGVFWLGVSGAVLLGGAASISKLLKKRTIDASGVFGVCLDVISISIAATIYSLVYSIIVGSEQSWIGLENTGHIAVGASMMAIIGFVGYSSLDLAFRLSEGTRIQRYGKRFSKRTIEMVPEIAASIVLCVLFAQFGIEIGLVVAPLAVMAMVAYRIHLKRLEQKTAQILDASRVHLATVEALATAIDARDQVGNGHVRRTQIYAVGLGKSLGLGEDEINALRTGSLLHDIGKLAVPDHILSKPGPLTPAELEKTKIHASVGASILEKVGFPYPVLPTIKHHHEFWNGEGYPDRLAGESIPLTARVLAIADAYDTLRSARTFRSAISPKDACDHLLERSGTQFDPNLLSVFLKKLAGFEARIDADGLSYAQTIPDIHRSIEDSPANYADQIKLANKEVFTLFELAREFGSSENLHDMISLFTIKIKELVPFDTCSVYLIDESKRFAHAVHVEGKNSQLLQSRRIKVGEGATGIVMKKRRVVKNVNPDLDFSLSHLELINQYSTMASLPLIAEDEVIGAVSIYSNDLPSYGDEHVRLLETISRIAAEAIFKSQQHAEARAHALTDPMTGLPNARSLQIHFEKEIGRSSRSGSSLQILVLDLDGFKAVNDTFGHKVGDDMLREVGAVIRGQLRDYDFLSRYGGDEFVALIPDAGFEDVTELRSRIESAVSAFRLPVDNDKFASVGVSVGIAGFPESGNTFEQMIVAADKAMYVRKSSRRLSRTIMRPPEILYEMLGEKAGDGISGQDLFDRVSSDGIIVELDESHIIHSSSIN
jgi:diguanylate cyclase (GGDEF)-like protein/putative nucleotidyltransferase with HDIG domain